MSIKAVDRSLDLPLKTVPKAILTALAENVNEKTGVGWPEVATIARRASQSERNVQKWFAMFEAWGLIRRERRIVYGKMRANMVQLNMSLMANPLSVVEAIRTHDASRKAAAPDGDDCHFDEAVYLPGLADLETNVEAESWGDFRGESESPLHVENAPEIAPGVTQGVNQESPLIDEPSNIPSPPTPQNDDPSFEDFVKAHPDRNAFTDAKAREEWDALTSGQKRKAIEMCQPYRQRLGNQRPTRAGTWLRNRGFADPVLKAMRAKSAENLVAVPEGSPQFEAWGVFRRLYGARPLLVFGSSHSLTMPSEWPPIGRALPAPGRWEPGKVPPGWVLVKRGEPNWWAWQEWLREATRPQGWPDGSPVDPELGGWCFPAPWPPRKDGTFAGVDPPDGVAAAVRQQDEAYLRQGGGL